MFVSQRSYHSFFFFFNDTATTEIYTLSLHDALPIWLGYTADYLDSTFRTPQEVEVFLNTHVLASLPKDRKSTRLNSSHSQISYAVFCLKKKQQARCDVHAIDHEGVVLRADRNLLSGL